MALTYDQKVVKLKDGIELDGTREKWLAVYKVIVDFLEGETAKLDTQLNVKTAKKAWLDLIGRKAGVYRDENIYIEDDEIYRAAILIRFDLIQNGFTMQTVDKLNELLGYTGKLYIFLRAGYLTMCFYELTQAELDRLKGMAKLIKAIIPDFNLTITGTLPTAYAFGKSFGNLAETVYTEIE